MVTELSPGTGNPEWTAVQLVVGTPLRPFTCPLAPRCVPFSTFLRVLLVGKILPGVRADEILVQEDTVYVLPTANLRQTALLVKAPLSAQFAAVGLATLPALHTSVEAVVSTP